MENFSDSTPQSAPERPLSVWLVSGWYFLSGIFSTGLIAAVQARFSALPQEERANLPSLTTPDILLAALMIAVNMTGAWFLFRLKKISLWFFYSALALNIVSNVGYLLRRGAGSEPALMLAGVVLGWFVALLVCRYVTTLARNGVLR